MINVTTKPHNVAHPQAAVYAALARAGSEPSPEMQAKAAEVLPDGMSIGKGCVTATVPQLGQVTLAVAEMVEPSAIKFEARQLPVGLSLWVRVEADGPSASVLRIEAEADVNPMLGAMFKKPLADGLERMADAMAAIDYTRLAGTGNDDNNTTSTT